MYRLIGSTSTTVGRNTPQEDTIYFLAYWVEFQIVSNCLQLN